MRTHDCEAGQVRTLLRVQSVLAMTPLAPFGHDAAMSDLRCRGMNGPSSRAVQDIRRHCCVAAFLHSQDPKRTPCDSKITKLRASLSTSLRLDHKISCWYGYAPFQSVRNKFKGDLRI